MHIVGLQRHAPTPGFLHGLWGWELRSSCLLSVLTNGAISRASVLLNVDCCMFMFKVMCLVMPCMLHSSLIVTHIPPCFLPSTCVSCVCMCVCLGWGPGVWVWECALNYVYERTCDLCFSDCGLFCLACHKVSSVFQNIMYLFFFWLSKILSWKVLLCSNSFSFVEMK